MALNVQKSLEKYSSLDWEWDLSISEIYEKNFGFEFFPIKSGE